MKLMLRGLALAVALIVPAVTQAEFVEVIDTFTQSGGSGVAQTGFADTQRTTVSGTASVKSVSAGILNVLTTSLNKTANWDLDIIGNLSGIQTQGNLGFNHYLQLRDLAVEGAWDLTVRATGTGGVGPAGAYTYAITTGGDQILDLSLLTNLGHLNGLTKLRFELVSTALNVDGAAQFTLGSMAIVPEPASMFLLGSTAIGGLIFNRRRKKALVA